MQHRDGVGFNRTSYRIVSSKQVGAGGQAVWFTTTHWTVVLAAGGEESPEAAQALEALCRTYWYALYAYIRRRGYAAPEAQDLTQEFLARLLATNGLASVDRRKGRFRSFLLASLNHFLANEWDRARAAKRGGAAEVLSLNDASVEARYALEASNDLTPERLYDRQWALALLDRALHRLQSELAAAAKAVSSNVSRNSSIARRATDLTRRSAGKSGSTLRRWPRWCIGCDNATGSSSGRRSLTLSQALATSTMNCAGCSKS